MAKKFQVVRILPIRIKDTRNEAGELCDTLNQSSTDGTIYEVREIDVEEEIKVKSVFRQRKIVEQ